MSDPLPHYPFEQASMDLFSYGGEKFLAYADRYSGYPMIAQWSNDPSSWQIQSVLISFFADLGIPKRIRSDNGPQFSAHSFKSFSDEWGFELVTSSPHYPASNGHAE